MKTYSLTTNDLVQHISGLNEILSNPDHLPLSSELQHPGLGVVHMNAFPVTGINTVQMSWQVPDHRIKISDTHPGNRSVSISFQLSGAMFTRFAGISHPLDMRAGLHNLVYLTEPGDSHIFEANQEMRVFQLEIDPVYFIQCLEGDNRWCNEVIENIQSKKTFAASEHSVAISPRMQVLIQSLANDTSSGPMKKLRFQSRVLELLALQIEQFSEPNKMAGSDISITDQQKLQDLKKYLNQHFLDELSLTRLSRISCLNEFKLKKGFRQLFGETVMSYVRKLRMEHASRLLLDTALSIEEVAMELQYEHAHHFSKAFKDYTGFLPSVFRNR